MRLFKKLVVLILALFASFGLVACKDDDIDPATKIQEALNSIALGNTNSLTQSFDLIKVTGKHKLPITWSIENVEGEQAALDLTGEVPRVIITQDPYDEDEEGNPLNKWGKAILTATITIGDVSDSRSWELWIKPADRVFVLSVGDAAKRAKGTPVKVTGTVSYVHGNGFYVEDETGALYVYGKPTDDKIKPGAQVEVEGYITIYYGQPEIEKYKVKVLEEATQAGYDYASVAEEAFVPEIAWLKASDVTAYGRVVTITGKVTEGTYGTNKNYEITDEASETKVMIYYDSEKAFIDAIKEKLGKVVKATVITYNFHSSDLVWRVFGYAGSIEETQAVQYTDADKIRLISLKLSNQFDGASVTSDLSLPTTISGTLFAGATITWESKNTSVIGNDGKFTPPMEETEVELVAKVKVGEAEQEFSYKVTAIAPQQMTVAELLAAIDQNKAKAVLVEGVIIGQDSGGYFYLADETGVVYTRVKLSSHNLEVGDKIRIIAEGSIYDGSKRFNRQLAADGKAVIEKVDDQKHDCPLAVVQAHISDFDHTITAENVIAKAKEEELFGKIFEISGYFVLVQSGIYYDLYLAESLEPTANKMRIYHSSMEVEALKILVGKEVTITAVVYECYPATGLWNLGFLGREGDLEVALTEAEKEALAEDEIEAILPEENVLVADLSFFNQTKYPYVLGNVTFEFSSSNTDILGNDGKFTAPEEDTNVELTVNVTFSETHTKEFKYTLTAKAPEEPEDPTLKGHFDFETDGGTSYGDTTTQVTNLADGLKVDFVSHRVSYQKTDAVEGATRAMVICPRIDGSDGTAYVEFSFGTDVITSMSFDLYFWNSSAEQYFTKLELQVKVGDQWTTVKDLLAEIAGTTVIKPISLTELSGSVFRFYAEGGRDGGNDARVCVDNLKAHITLPE